MPRLEVRRCDCKGEGESFTFVGRPLDTLHHRPPLHELIVADRAKLEQGIVRVRVVFLELFEEALLRGLCASGARHLLVRPQACSYCFSMWEGSYLCCWQGADQSVQSCPIWGTLEASASLGIPSRDEPHDDLPRALTGKHRKY